MGPVPGPLDEYSLGSHAKAAAAQDSGAFDGQIVAIRPDGTVVGRRGRPARQLAGEAGALKTPFKPDGVVTAGNASQISDGAAALLVMTSERAAELGLRPLARIHTAAVAADDPVIMLTAPIPATEKVLKRAGLAIDDIGAYEVNEAFASVPLAWLAETGANPDRLNPNGGAIALGHPLGGSGARLMTTLVHHMRDRGRGTACRRCARAAAWRTRRSWRTSPDGVTAVERRATAKAFAARKSRGGPE